MCYHNQTKVHYFLQFEIHTSKERSAVQVCLWNEVLVCGAHLQEKRAEASAVPRCLWHLATRSASCTYAFPSFVSSLQTCFLQRYQGFFFVVVVERSIPFLCGEAMLANYKRSCFKTGIPMNLPKQAISLVAFFHPVSCCPFSDYFPN